MAMTSPSLLTSLRRELGVLVMLLRRRAYTSPKTQREIVDAFHRLYYDSYIFNKTWSATRWMGTGILKCPLDLWIYQEIIHDLRPDLIVETGTSLGGSAAYMAALCDLIDNGRIVTVDIVARDDRPRHARISYVTGSSVAPEIVAEVEKDADASKTVLVILDSDHTRDHVLAEMRAYAGMVTIGSYMIVEDSNLNGHPAYPGYGPGPMEAIQQFLREDDRFVVDEGKEKFFLTFNPRGYLKRVR